MKTSFFSQSLKKNLLTESFSCVFLPTALSLLSVVVFLRLGWIISVGGALQTYGIISLATLISLITALSLATTASNTKIGHGGIYFVLSRTFGIELSAAISIPLYLAQTLGITFYTFGFVETLTVAFPSIPFKITSAIVLLVITCLSLNGSKAILKGQLVIFCGLILSLGLFFLSSQRFENVPEIYIQRLPFWVLFSIFFPAVTGIEGGVALSKELKNPSRSIPLGLFCSITFAYLIYLLLTHTLTASFSMSLLNTHPLIICESCTYQKITYFGVLFCMLSGALTTLLSAPKTLDALSRDRVIPSFFKKRLQKESKTPHVAIISTSLLAMSAILIGELNNIAQLLTMFFLISYMVLNSATGLESLISNPSWRPSLKTPAFIPICGSVVCLVVMLMINPGTTIVALFLVTLIYVVMKKRNLSSNWDDIRYSISLHFAKSLIFKLTKMTPSAKAWRPNLLVFLPSTIDPKPMLYFPISLTHKKGFLIAAFNRLFQDTRKINDLFAKFENENIPIIQKSFSSKGNSNDYSQIIKHTGLGALTPNTIILQSPTQDSILETVEIIRECQSQKKNVILTRLDSLPSQNTTRKKVDIWWGGKGPNNSELMLVLGYMLVTSKEWADSTLTLKTTCSVLEDFYRKKQKLASLAKSSRLNIETSIIQFMDQSDIFADCIIPSSKDSDIVLLGLKSPKKEELSTEYAQYLSLFLEKISGIPNFALVLANEDIHFKKILK